jgi:hypothetical protein
LNVNIFCAEYLARRKSRLFDINKISSAILNKANGIGIDMQSEGSLDTHDTITGNENVDEIETYIELTYANIKV